MLFNSFAFLYFSIAVAAGLLLLRRREYQHLFVVVMSCYFYWFSSGNLLFLLLITMVVDFTLARMIHESSDPRKRKRLVLVSVISNLGVLAIFKYANFSIHNVNALLAATGIPVSFNLLHIALPIGVSFYTFESLSYTLDVYWRRFKPVDSFLSYAMFITFFPHLVAGPIVRAADFLPQLRQRIRFLPRNFRRGLTRVLWGLVKKIVFADNIAVFVNAFFVDPSGQGTLAVWLAALAFGIQIYLDFSGYSDIAIGLARMIGIEIKMNFDKPYFSVNVSEFWRRWHISLSSWLRDYLYIPLGGSRRGTLRTYGNLMLTMVLGGLWHGAAWNFFFWGLYQGTLLALHRFFESIGLTTLFSKLGAARTAVSLLITQYFVFLGWLIFRVPDRQQLFALVQRYVGIGFRADIGGFLHLVQTYRTPLLFLLLFIAIHAYTYTDRNMIERIARAPLALWFLYCLVAVLALYVLAAPVSAQFIYFQF